MKTLKSIAIAFIIVMNSSIVSFAQLANITVNHPDANRIFVMTSRYVNTYPKEAFGFIYGKEAMNELLKTENTQKVYVFNALDENGMNKVVFKAADGNGQILPEGNPYDEVVACPPYCPRKNIAQIGSAVSEDFAYQVIDNFQKTYRSREKAQLFEKADIEKVLAQDGTEGLYFGHALNEKEQQVMIVAGVNGDGSIMWDGVVINNSIPIPALQNLGYPANDIAAKK